MIGPAPRVAVPALSRSERSCMSPSVAPVRRSDSIARHNARSRAVVRTSSVSPPILSSLPQYGRYGYRKITALLRQARWTINDKRVERIWQREGLKIPHQQPKRGRLWLTNGACIRLRPEQRNHVWSYDFVEDRTHDGRKYRMLKRARRVHPRMSGDPCRPQAQ